MSEEERLVEAMLHLAEAQARLVLLELHAPSLMPVWLMIIAEGNADILPTPWKDEREKQDYVSMVRILMRKRKVVAYSFLTEAWTAHVRQDEVDQKTNRLRNGVIEARHRPDRQEVVIACACTTTLARWKRWQIVREATTERIIKLEEQPELVGEEAESWLTEMLK